ncbi:glycosyltransferase [Burkholderia pyrrocinia]|nr:glycosyltransferase [Burkholderia pyrrocinia]
MIEAMSCGTPVIAFNRGSVPEAIDHGITGHVCEDVQRAAGVLQRLDELPRTETRARFERRFSAGAMAQRYVDRPVPLLQAARHPILGVQPIELRRDGFSLRSRGIGHGEACRKDADRPFSCDDRSRLTILPVARTHAPPHRDARNDSCGRGKCRPDSIRFRDHHHTRRHTPRFDHHDSRHRVPKGIRQARLPLPQDRHRQTNACRSPYQSHSSVMRRSIDRKCMSESFSADGNHVDVREEITHEWMVAGDILLSTRLRVCTVRDACGGGQVEEPCRLRESPKFDLHTLPDRLRDIDRHGPTMLPAGQNRHAGRDASRRSTFTHIRRACREAERDTGRGGCCVFLRCRSASFGQRSLDRKRHAMVQPDNRRHTAARSTPWRPWRPRFLVNSAVKYRLRIERARLCTP